MLSVHLHNLLFHANHGVYDEEKLLGNEYEVNMDIEVGQEGKIDSIHQTVNYVAVYHLIKNCMQVPTQLLETLAQDIVEEVSRMDERIRSVHISIKKLHPPVVGFEGSVGVSYTKRLG